MLCKDCLKKASEKLRAEEIVILEYLYSQKATIPQCSISREVIRDELNSTNHKCYSSLERLECYDFVEKNSKGKTSKYFITESGIAVIGIFEDKMKKVI